MQRLRIPHVPYTVIWDQGAPYSVCEDFVQKDTELVPAWRIFQSQKRSNSASVYRHFVNCCEMLGIKDAVAFLDRMIVLDYIIANEDRHFNNFGTLGNAETLEWLGMAPIYDSGSSLGYDKLPAQMRSDKDVICKPFKNHHAEQLKLVSSFDWVDFDRLADAQELILRMCSPKKQPQITLMMPVSVQSPQVSSVESAICNSLHYRIPTQIKILQKTMWKKILRRSTSNKPQSRLFNGFLQSKS